MLCTQGTGKRGHVPYFPKTLLNTRKSLFPPKKPLLQISFCTTA